MSELFEKLEQRKPIPGTKARASRAQLEKRWGCLISGDFETIRISSMNGGELWRLVFGRGKEAVFERSDEAGDA